MANKTEVKGGLINLTISNPISASLRSLPKRVQVAVNKVVKDTAALVEQRIVDDTPRDRGSGGGASSKWTSTTVEDGTVTLTNDAPQINVLEFGGYPVVGDRKKTRKKKAKKKKKKKTVTSRRAAVAKKAKRERTGPGFKRGNATLGGFPPGPRTQVAPGGSPTMTSNVSRQAPSGMVRQNLERIQPRFVFDLEEAVEESLSDIAEAGP